MSQVFNPTRIPHTWSGTGVTGAGGLLTINFPTPFTSTPAVTATPLTASANTFFWHLNAASATSVTIHVTQAALVVLLGIQLLAFPSDAVGITVHVHAIEQGEFLP